MSAMNREAFLDKGERVFVGTVAFVLALETLTTIVGSGTQFAWPRLILGVFGGIFILYLAQRLYAGDRSVEKVALAWSVFQIVLLLASLVVGPDARGGFAEFVQGVGYPWRGLALLKLIAYASFAAGLVMRSSPRAFLADKRGDDTARYLPEIVADVSTPVTWTAEQAQLFGSLAGLMLASALVLVLTGLFIVATGVTSSFRIAPGGLLAIVEGILMMGLGALLFLPAVGLTSADGAALGTTGRVQNALKRLTWWHLGAGGIGLLLAVVVVARFLVTRAST